MTDDGFRVVDVKFYGEKQDDNDEWYITADGTGSFWLSIYEPYPYTFEETYANMVAMNFYGETVPLPELKAYYYDINDEYLYDGEFIVYAFTPTPTEAAKEFVDALLEQGYKYVGNVQGLDAYVAPDEEIEILIYVNAKTGVILLGIAYLPGPFELEGDTLTAETLQMSADDDSYKTYTFTAESGAEYELFGAYDANGIKMNKGQSAGFVVTKGVTEIAGIKFTVSKETIDGNGFTIYGSNQPFTVADMYAEELREDITVIYEASISEENGYVVGGEMDEDEHYAYIGIAINKGTVYFEEIIVAWAEPAEDKPEEGGDNPTEGGEGQEQQGNDPEQGQPQGGEGGEENPSNDESGEMNP